MITYLSEKHIRTLLPKRDPYGNKGTFGKVMLICGSEYMRGAAALALLGALRMGAGLVTLAGTRTVIDTLSSSIFEAVWLDREKNDCTEAAKRMNAVGIGCGMGQGNDTLSLTLALLSEDTSAPLVIDADAINILSNEKEALASAKRPVILTPHPLEFSRLTGLSVDEIQADRVAAASSFAKEFGITVLLKGKDTVITDGEHTLINTSGSSALAKGGSGDVLTGMICAFLAQGCTTVDAAAIAAYCHGAAGERLAKAYSEYGVLPSEIPAEAAKFLCEKEKHND